MATSIKTTYTSGHQWFPGFYETSLTYPAGMDEVEYANEKGLITEKEYRTIVESYDYKDYMKTVVDLYCDKVIPIIEKAINGCLPSGLSIKFHTENRELYSPKQYNYSTDQVTVGMEIIFGEAYIFSGDDQGCDIVISEIKKSKRGAAIIDLYEKENGNNRTQEVLLEAIIDNIMKADQDGNTDSRTKENEERFDMIEIYEQRQSIFETIEPKLAAKILGS